MVRAVASGSRRTFGTRIRAGVAVSEGAVEGTDVGDPATGTVDTGVLPEDVSWSSDRVLWNSAIPETTRARTATIIGALCRLTADLTGGPSSRWCPSRASATTSWASS